jgi:uncharacterized protein (TIGR02145 family)
MTAPTVLPNDTWGFAVEKQAGIDNSFGFDITYGMDRQNNKYALLPTTDQTIYQTDKAFGESPAPLSSFMIYYGTKLTLATIAGEYKTTITYSSIGEEIPPPPEVACVSGSKYKGRLGNIINAATATVSWAVGDTGIATDTRNSQDYCIGKLADGNIWMLNNLKLGSASAIALKSDDTNLPSGVTFNLPALTKTDSYAYDQPYIYADDFDGGANKSATTDINSPDFYGYYYNWCAAKVGQTESCTDQNVVSTFTAPDICPANWRMPIGGDVGDIDNEFDVLNAKMAGFADNQGEYLSEYGDYLSFDRPIYADNFEFTGPFRGVLAGSRYDGQWLFMDDGYVWSASPASTEQYAYLLYLGNGDVGPGTYWSRQLGLSVRCLLKP